MNTRNRGIMVMLLCVLAGAVLGAAGDRAYMYRELSHMFKGKDGGTHESGLPGQFERLNLSDAQKTQMLNVIHSQQPQTDTVLKEVWPRVRAIELNIKQNLVCVLTKQQQDEWLAWRKQQGLNMNESNEWLAKSRSGKCTEK